MLDHLLSPQLTQALGWTLLHSLWQGAAFAILLGVVLVALRSYSAQARYTIAVGLFAGFFLTAGTTCYVQYQQSAATQIISAYTSAASDATTAATNITTIGSNPAPVQVEASSQASNIPTIEAGFITSLKNYYQRHLPLLVTLWLLGILVLQLRWLGQLAFVQRMRHYGTRALPEAWSGKVQQLEEKLRIQRKVSYRTSARATTPMVIGWLKPVILVPQAMLTKLTESELYAVLAHELAHVRRDDFAVNLAQTLLTNVFFFHPGIWWMSSRIDDEREHCCDDLAIAATGQALPYAKTLLSVSDFASGLRQNNTQHDSALAIAFTGKNRDRGASSFTMRVKRLFSSQAGIGTFREGFATALILSTAIGLSLIASSQSATAMDTEMALAAPGCEVASPVAVKPNYLPIATQKHKMVEAAFAIDLPKPLEIKKIFPIEQLSVRRNLKIDGQRLGNSTEYLQTLIRACYEGDLETVRRLVSEGADVNAIGTDGYTPLIAAASNNAVAIADYLIEKGADVNLMTVGWTALIEAADEDSYEVLDLLLRKGAKPNLYLAATAPTAATMAASEGHLRCLKRLVEAGADVNGFGESLAPIITASEEGNTHIVAYLIAQQANVNVTDQAGRTALMFATSEGHAGVVQQLLDANASTDIRDATGRSAKDYAMMEDEFALAVKLGADPEQLPESWQRSQDYGRFRNMNNINQIVERSLEIAARETENLRFNLDTARWMQDVEEALQSSEIELQEARMRLQEATQRRQQSMQQLNHRFNSNEHGHGHSGGHDHHSDYTGYKGFNLAKRTPLAKAVSEGDVDDIARFLSEGADPNDAGYNQEYPLYIAVSKGNIKAANLLLEKGADVNSTTEKGFGNLHMAALTKNGEMADLLIKHGAKIDAQAYYAVSKCEAESGPICWTYADATPLIVAVESSAYDVVKRLVAAGANVKRSLTKTEKWNSKVTESQSNNGMGSRSSSKRSSSRETTTDDWTAILQAEQQGDKRMMKLLGR